MRRKCQFARAVGGINGWTIPPQPTDHATNDRNVVQRLHRRHLGEDSVSMRISATTLVARGCERHCKPRCRAARLSPGREYNSRRSLGRRIGGRPQAVRRVAHTPRGRALPSDVPRYTCSVATSTSRARAFARHICRGVRQRTRMSAGLATTTARHCARLVATLRRLRL